MNVRVAALEENPSGAGDLGDVIRRLETLEEDSVVK